MGKHSAGDIHDYFKFGFLRTLAYSGLKVGIQAYCSGEVQSGNGPYTRYLGNPQRYRSCDPELFNSIKILQGSIQSEKRFIDKLAQSHLFPSETVFYTDPLDFEGMPLPYREQHRQGWFAYGQSQMTDCDVIFLNPKCGLEIKTVNPYTEMNGPNYVSEAELASVTRTHKTVIIHQRIARSSVDNALQKYSKKIQVFTNRLEIDYLQFTEGLPSLLLIVPARNHHQQLKEILKTYRASNWGKFLNKSVLAPSVECSVVDPVSEHSDLELCEWPRPRV